MQTDHTIYHVCARAVAEQAQRSGELRSPSLATEGFIHCAQAHQVRGVVERYYAGQADLVVLALDPARLGAPVRYEPPSSLPRRAGAAAADRSELFPHVYGPLNAHAIMQVIECEAFLKGQA